MHLFIYLIIFSLAIRQTLTYFHYPMSRGTQNTGKKGTDSLWFWFLSCYEVLSRASHLEPFKLWTLSSISVRRDDRIYYSSIAMQQISPKIMAYRNKSAFSCFLYWKSGWLWFDWITAPLWFSEPTLMESSESTLMLLAYPCGLFSWLCSVELDWEPCLEFLTMWPLPWCNSLLFPS